ncbi:hypothetical protein KEM54_006729 [Ascosphaera aggregata]|nr:hypothetical protein KEM54_006729 [Ascosphaera aggregata]
MSVSAETKRYLAEKGIKPHPRHLAVALQRANEIQRRKEVENLILSRIENLTTLPTNSTASAADPSSEDVFTLKHALIPFQPSDFDDLISERNVEGLCGYPLCPKPPRKLRGPGGFRVAWASGTQATARQATVISKAEYEKWCSNDCIERAMYLRLQLIEKPSWEREACASPKFELLNERRAKKKAAEEAKNNTEKQTEHKKEEEGQKQKGEQTASSIEDKMKRLGIESNPTDSKPEQRKLKQDELAMERGDASNTTKYYDPKGYVRILEKETDGTNSEPPSALNPGAGAIEGYEPKYMHNPSTRRRAVEGDEVGYHDEDDEYEEGSDILPQI